MIDLKRLAVVVVAAASACSLDPNTESAPGALTICDIFVCGGNSPTSGDGFLFDELNTNGAFNYAGVQITHTTLGATPLKLGVDRHFFFARDPSGTEYRGAKLIGAIVSFKHASGDQFEVRFSGYDEQSLHFLTGSSDLIPVYLLQVRNLGENKFNRFACNHVPIPVDSEWSLDPHLAIVYGGERYSAKEKRVISSDPKSPWAFLACAGSGGAKMHMHRHTLAGSLHYPPGGGPGPALYPTTLGQRTTLMKAITADYCGDGAATNTVPGQPLRYAANRPWWLPPDLTVPAGVASIEAIWTPGGAVCLDAPRYIPGPVSCGGVPIPPCGGSAGWTSGGYAITANP